MQCHSAIAVLLALGADPLLRNGSDPYQYDGRLRLPEIGMPPDLEPRHFVDPTALGLSALDIAAKIRDPFLFQYLLKESARVDINAADEEGLAAIHRLTYSWFERTSRGNRFRSRAFQGSIQKQRANLEETITAIRKLGGDIDMPVSPLNQGASYVAQSNQIVGFTPLMLAMWGGDFDVLEILIKNNVDVQHKNNTGKNVLMCFGCPPQFPLGPRREERYLHAVKLLVSHGADIHARTIDDNTAILAAAEKRHVSIVGFLLEKGADPDQHYQVETHRSLWMKLGVQFDPCETDIAIARLFEALRFFTARSRETPSYYRER